MNRWEARAWSLALLLTMLVLVAQRVREHDAVLVFDEFDYARHARHHVETLRTVLHGPAPDQGRLTALQAWGEDVVAYGRPPFFFPATLVQGGFDLSWSISVTVLVTALFWLGILLLSAWRLAAWSAPDRPAAVPMMLAAIVLCAQFWDSATILMGDLPVASAFTALLCALVAVRRRGAVRDYLAFGLALCLGLLSKPIFAFFAIPLILIVALIWIRRLFHAPEKRPSKLVIVASFLAMALPPSILSWILFDTMLHIVREVNLMNEKLAYYQSAGDFRLRAGWPATFLSAGYPIWCVPPLLLIALIGAGRRSGRWCWLFGLAFLGYATFVVEQRGARHFASVFVLLALCVGEGGAFLAPRFTRPLARGLAVVALLFAIAGAASLGFLNDTVFQRRTLRYVEQDGERMWLALKARPILDADAAGYEALKIPELIEATGMRGDREATLFTSFSTAELNWSSYQSWLLQEGVDAPFARRVYANTFRFGGFGDEGGLSSRFFTANFVAVKNGAIWSVNPDTERYHLMIAEQLSVEGTPLRVGLLYRGSFLTEGRGEVFLFERMHEPSVEDWVRIARHLVAFDPDNPWNARWAHEVLKRSEVIPDAEALDLAARWILSFAEAPDKGPRLDARFAYRDAFPVLTESYAAAWEAARRHLDG